MNVEKYKFKICEEFINFTYTALFASKKVVNNQVLFCIRDLETLLYFTNKVLSEV